MFVYVVVVNTTFLNETLRCRGYLLYEIIIVYLIVSLPPLQNSLGGYFLLFRARISSHL